MKGFSGFSSTVLVSVLLVLVIAPLTARALRPATVSSRNLWTRCALFIALLWCWYSATGQQVATDPVLRYAGMHASLLLGAVLLWRSLLQLAPMQSLAGLGAATLTAAQMSALGIRIAFAGQPLYAHIPLADQRLGGLLLWIPGMVIFVGVALRFLGRLGASLRQAGLLH